VCIPPPARDRDLGPSVLVVAARLCRELRAMLIVDPPAAWETCDEALQGLRELDFQSGQALMCVPRIQAYDRLRGRYETFANSGAVAGVLSRLDEQRSPWQAGADDELLLRPGTRATLVLTEAERTRLAAHGVNPLQSLRSANPQSRELRTLAGGAGRSSDSTLLTPRRRALLVMNSIERGTRWAVFEAADRRTWLRVTRQVQEFLQPLEADGLFGPAGDESGFYVVCDERVNTAEDVAAGRINILVGLRTARAGEHRSFLVTHSPGGSRIRPVRSNWLPAGTRMTVKDVPERGVPATPQPRTVAQELFGHYAEPRPGPSMPASDGRDAETAATGRFDLESLARFHQDFGRSSERL
jgi:hypothetical protein